MVCLKFKIIFTIFLCHTWNVTMSISCSDMEVIIKGVDIFPSYTVYQNARVGYIINRTQYDMTVNFNYPNYSNRTVWRQMLDNNSLTDVAYSSLELELTRFESEKFPDLMMVPTMLGVLVHNYNLPNITELNLTLDTIVDIYLKKITHWNSTALQMINPGIVLPDEKIILLLNTFDATVDSYILTTILSAYSDEFKHNIGIVDDLWTNHTYTTYIHSNAWFVNRTAYSIGYSSLVNLVFYHLVGTPIARILNTNGSTPERSVDSVLSSASMIFVDNDRQTVKLIRNETLLKKLSSPFVYFHYTVVNRTTSPNVSCCASQETVGFIEYFLDSTAKNYKDMVTNGYFPLPKLIADYVKSTLLPNIKCNGSVAINEFRMYVQKESTVFMEKSTNLVAIGLSLSVVLIVAIGSFVWYSKRVQLAKEKFWFIDQNEFIFVEDKQKTKAFGSVFSITTYQSDNLDMMQQNKMGKTNVILAQWKRTNMDVIFKRLMLKHVSSWNRKSKTLITSFIKDITHPNLCSIHGITTFDKQPHLISQHCSKGTLNYVLSSCPYQLSRDIKCSLAQDISSGLKYLHQKDIVHGNLSSVTCYVDSVWNVKLADWAIFSVNSSENVKQPEVKTDSLEDEESLITLLYLDPEMLPSNVPSPVNDLYSYGMLLVEIFTRKLPFSEEVELCATTYPDIIKNKFIRIECTPEMNPNEVPQEIKMLVKQLIGPIVLRPPVRMITKRIHQIRGRTNKSVVDIMMETMERYVVDLEEKVLERNSELVDITNRMKDLLNELLPPQIAMKFIKREPIVPEFYECVTILFSDIVGFTTISARSTPYQVMTFLNELWNLFDKTMEYFDVYKVDTIGDAYMVASGLPNRNGIDHCKQIADLALALICDAKDFCVPHIPDEKVLIRMGINSGPVTAGIVGQKMPQYCIFGDTVNTASRMESTSLPLHIHVSEFSAKLTQQYFPQYLYTYRGETEVKGKGIMKTFWLENSESTTLKCSRVKKR